MPDWYPQKPSDFVMIYAVVIALGLLFFLRRRPRKGMLLRLRASRGRSVERPLNVMFNYNGHSWDAYEVLGLPAGSSPEKVTEAFSAAMQTIDPGSRPFLEAAHRAIHTERAAVKKVGS